MTVCKEYDNTNTRSPVTSSCDNFLHLNLSYSPWCAARKVLSGFSLELLATDRLRGVFQHGGAMLRLDYRRV
jgi:hypothetical protein